VRACTTSVAARRRPSTRAPAIANPELDPVLPYWYTYDTYSSHAESEGIAGDQGSARTQRLTTSIGGCAPSAWRGAHREVPKLRERKGRDIGRLRRIYRHAADMPIPSTVPVPETRLEPQRPECGGFCLSQP
jgi:hypothetical protein